MRARLWIGCIVTVLTMASHAPAQDDKEDAQRLFERGRELMKQRRYPEACALLEKSFTLVRGIGAQYNLARCLEEQGRAASAHRHFLEVAEVARRAGQPDRARVAEEHARALEARLSWLRIEVASPVAELTIFYGKAQLPRAKWSEEVAVDPGEYRVRASAPGHRSWEKTVTISGEAQRAVVRVPPLTSVATTKPDPLPKPGPREKPPSFQALPLLVTGGIVGGVGLIALGVSGGLAAVAVSKDDEADAFCDDTGCEPQGVELGNTARSYGSAATITLVTGALLAGGGLALLITGLVGKQDTGFLVRGVRF